MCKDREMNSLKTWWDNFLWNSTFITFEVFPEVIQKNNQNLCHFYIMKGPYDFHIPKSWEIRQSQEVQFSIIAV